MTKLREIEQDPRIHKFHVAIGPNDAAYWLVHNNGHNRPEKKQLTKRYARDMSRPGGWVYCADPIRFDWNNQILDGAHRLRAIVMSGVTVEFDVVTGLDPASQLFMDQGGKRTAGDQAWLKLRIKDANHIAAAANVIMSWDLRDLVKRSVQFSAPEIVDWVEPRTEELAKANKIGRAVQTKLKRINRPVTTAAAFLTFRANAVEAGKFWDGLTLGRDLSDGSPVLALRERFLLRKGPDDVYKPYEEFYLYARAWRGFLGKEKLQDVILARGGVTADHLVIR